MNNNSTGIVILHTVLILGGAAAAAVVFISLQKSPLPLQVALAACTAGFFYFLLRRVLFKKRSPAAGAQPLSAARRSLLAEHVYYYQQLDSAEQQRFEQRVAGFLHNHRITGIDTAVDDRLRVLAAAAAVIPVFQFRNWHYANLSEVLVYPDRFGDDFNSDDQEAILGMVGIGHAMVLSKPDLLNGFRQHNDSRNVAIHEFAHIVDGADGSIDGIPAALADRRTVKLWNRVSLDELEAIRTGISPLNPYGGTNRTEFFAVACEQFFENPLRMEQNHPELYRLLQKIFRQDTRGILTRKVKQLFGIRRKTGRNAPCPCGSGRKFKHCCLPRQQ